MIPGLAIGHGVQSLFLGMQSRRPALVIVMRLIRARASCPSNPSIWGLSLVTVSDCRFVWLSECILLVLLVCKFLLSEWILFHLAEIVFLKLDCPFHYLSSSFRSSTAWWFVRGCLASFVWQNCCLSNSCLIRHLKWAVGFFWGSCHHVKCKEERAAVFYFSTESGKFRWMRRQSPTS